MNIITAEASGRVGGHGGDEGDGGDLLVPRKYATVAQRREQVREWNAAGMKDTRIAYLTMTSREVIKKDRAVMNIPRWSPIDDGQLLQVVGQLKTDLHCKVGRESIESNLVGARLNIQRRRIREAQVHLDILQKRAGGSIRRMPWYEGVGVDWIW